MSTVQIYGADWQVTDHCAERFAKRVLGDESVPLSEARAQAEQLLRSAKLHNRKPRTLLGDGEADLWAVCAQAIFPLRRDRGKLVAVTCLVPWL